MMDVDIPCAGFNAEVFVIPVTQPLPEHHEGNEGNGDWEMGTDLFIRQTGRFWPIAAGREAQKTAKSSSFMIVTTPERGSHRIFCGRRSQS